MVGLISSSPMLDHDTDANEGIGAADITKLRLNGYYTVAVMRFPYLSTFFGSSENLLEGSPYIPQLARRF